jgi:transcriptional regulator with XRE-family HTH domain
MMTEIQADFTWAEIGMRIRDWRLARGWSQQQLAEAAGMSQSGVVHLEKGDTNPQLTSLREVAAAFGKSLRELMFGAVSSEPTPAAWEQRVRRIVDSNDKEAVAAMECGVTTAELLLERRSARVLDQRAPNGGVIGEQESPATSDSPADRPESPGSRRRRGRP